jgi:hypothetical protein
VNGRLVEEKIFAQFAAVSAGDMGKLMEMYSTMNFCGGGTSLTTQNLISTFFR